MKIDLVKQLINEFENSDFFKFNLYIFYFNLYL